MSIFFPLPCSLAFSNAAHSRFWCRDPKLSLLDYASFGPSPNLHTFILLVKLYQFKQCFG